MILINHIITYHIAATEPCSPTGSPTVSTWRGPRWPSTPLALGPWCAWRRLTGPYSEETARRPLWVLPTYICIRSPAYITEGWWYRTVNRCVIILSYNLKQNTYMWISYCYPRKLHVARWTHSITLSDSCSLSIKVFQSIENLFCKWCCSVYTRDLR